MEQASEGLAIPSQPTEFLPPSMVVPKQASPSRCCRYLRTALALCAWSYLLLILLAWLVLYVGGDRWYLATLVLFGPRSVYAAPLAILVPAAAWLPRRLLLPLAVCGLIACGPLMGLCLPLGRGHTVEGATIRVLTCNVKGHCKDNAVLNTLIRQLAPDIVALQGCWQAVRVDWPAGWHVSQEGEVLLASRYPLRIAPPPADNRQQPRFKLLHRVVAGPFGDFHFVALHLPSIHDGISEILDRSTVIRPSRSEVIRAEIALRRRASEETSRWISAFPESVIAAGDFNMPTDSTIYRDCWTHLHNAFSRCGFGFGYTEWPTVRGWQFGIRIDHVLTGPAWSPLRCWVGPDVDSDHLPVIADLVWAGPPRQK
jgi:vancomycin resistance protein VanJ